MKVYQTNEIKNIALLGNDGSGKTTLTEALLYEAGLIKRRGRITAKNTVSDYFPVEQEYGYSVFSTVYHVEWNNKKLNIIDCPGSDDFVGAALTALNVTETAVLLLNGQYGAEVGTQNHFRYTEKLGKPVIFLVNQLDDEKCDYDAILEQLTSIYGNKVVPVQYPIKTGPDFNALIDVLLMKKYSWGPEGGEPTIEEIPEDQNGGYSNDDLKVLADNEAQKIIDYGLDEVIEEVDRLASKGAENMTPRERLVFANLAGYRKSEEEKRELAKIGVSEKTLEDEEFTDFAGKLNPSLSIKEKWELFNKYRPQKEIEPIGSMKSSGGADTGVKDFYTREEALKLTKEDFDKNPELYKAVDNTMKHWK